MKKKHSRLQELIKGYLAQSLTVEEKDELWNYITDPSFEAEAKAMLGSSFDEVEPVDLEESKQHTMLQHIFKEEPVQSTPPIVRRIWPKVFVAAATVALVVGIGLYFYPKPEQLTLDQMANRNGIKPGGNKALLTFTDGKKVTLSESHGGISIDTNKISYEDGSTLMNASTTTPYVISTPKGGTYQLSLPDGTRVWLNAASTFKLSGLRTVDLDGEAYFEVAKDQEHPFIVNGIDQNVKTWGARFNISNYSADKGSKTTLFDGNINVEEKKGGKSVFLKQGQQSFVTSNTLMVKEVDTAKISAWKKGDFIFDNDDIKTVMDQIAKWYDVEMVYVGKPSKEHFTGQISRSKSIGAILEIIEKTRGIKFEIVGRTIKVIQ
jgi:transmembrane sensor